MADVIYTDRLTLRRFRDSDAAPVAQLLNTRAVSRWLTHVPYPYGPQDALAFFAKTAEQQHVYAVCDDAGLIGCVSLQSELGYWYGQPFWGRGYATEAARALLDLHFSTSRDTVLSGYHLGNAGSQNVLQKLGFAPTETRSAFSQAQQVDVTIQGMALSHDIWKVRS